MLRHRNKRYLLISLVGLALLAFALYIRPVPKIKPVITQPQAQPTVLQPVTLAWPAAGQAAVGAAGYGVLATHNSSTAVPMASTAKVMVALAVLDKQPLSPGQQGPSITMTDDDVADYLSSRAQGESVLPVYTGEQITEYQALEAMLLPSANNIARTLAIWAFGSEDAYLTYAKQKAAQLDLTNTHFDDASGFSPQTVSTASDLVLLGIAAMKSAEIASITAQPQANLPIAGTVKNLNFLLGSDGVVGIKTGNTDQAGGCFLLAANRTVDNQPVLTVLSVMSSPDLGSAIVNARSLLLSTGSGYSQKTVPFISTYKAPWGSVAQAETATSLLAWQSSPIKQTSVLKEMPAGSSAGAIAGAVTVKIADYSKTVPVRLNQPLKQPPIWWRIFHF